MAGRPQLIRDDRQLLFGGMGRLSESSVLNLKTRRSRSRPDARSRSEAEGVIIALGGGFGGWSVYAKKGILKYCYNFFGVQAVLRREHDGSSPTGRHQVRVEFEYDGGGPAKGGNVTLYIDGKQVGSGRVDHTQPVVFSADETCDIGTDYGSPVTNDYSQRELHRHRELGRADRGRRRQSGEALHLGRGSTPPRHRAAMKSVGRQ